MKLLVVGAGRLGSALACQWAAAGCAVTVLARSGPQAALAGQPIAQLAAFPVGGAFDAVVVCVPDGAVAALAQDCQPHAALAPVWLHTAGALPSRALAAVGAAATGVLHPLAAVIGPAEPSPLRGALFAVGGDARAVAAARRLAELCGGVPAEVADEQKAAYHAAAALVANDWVALFAAAERLLRGAGLQDPAFAFGMLHLAQTALQRVRDLPAGEPAVAGLTGAVARGDAGTVARHLRALAGDPRGRALHAAASALLAEELQARGRLAGEKAHAILAAVDDAAASR